MTTSPQVSLQSAYSQATQLLLDERTPDGWWQGQLSTSALSTATAVMTLSLATDELSESDQRQHHLQLIEGGLSWLIEHQNQDGGWGDTVVSVSNISTTMLANAVFHKTGTAQQFEESMVRSQEYIDHAGGVDAVIRRYGKDHTFSVPILTHCALAGIVDWKRVMPLPFELSCVPMRFYAAVRMPVVSYALPALIAIGQLIFKRRGHWNPLVRWIRKASMKRSMRILESIQPQNGGFLEATPLTSFVCMSLLGSGYKDSIVTKRCLEFIIASVRPDGSWPIDTSLTTWVTTLSVNAMSGAVEETNDTPVNLLSDSLPSQDTYAIRKWLLDQQYKTVHPYTNSPPGGWSWIDLPGGVPDADDTPGAMLAIMNLRPANESFTTAEVDALKNAATWLFGLQNRDGGWPTFCRGWGTLPFDRSSNDLTAHVMRALVMWLDRMKETDRIEKPMQRLAKTSIEKGMRYLAKTQAKDGSWLPLWFGNQFNKDDENPLYGTAKVVLALKECRLLQTETAQQGVAWLLGNQNDDGGWSGRKGLESSTEETGLAVEALAGMDDARSAVKAGVDWLTGRLRDGTVTEPSPIGFYFAKLWYFERLYPIIFCVAALRRVLQDERVD